MSGLVKGVKEKIGRGKGGQMREREFCKICGASIDYTTEGGGEWFNVDISKGHCSWHPFCEIILCSKCVEGDKEKCAQLIIDLLK